MLFTCSGSSNVKNQRIVVIEEGGDFSQRPGSSTARRDESPQSGRRSQGSASCPETFQPHYADTSSIRSHSVTKSCENLKDISRTEILRPGEWTKVSTYVRLRALSQSEQQEVFEAQKEQGLSHKLENASVTKMDEITDGSGTQGIDLLHRVPDSPGSRSNYGEFYWDEYRDTSGENVYHISDSFDSDLMLEIDGFGKGASAARLDRTQEDLHKYRQRIDANVEHQREYSDMIGALQHKVQEYRRHIADLESRMAARRSDEPSSFTLMDTAVHPDGRYRDEIIWSSKRGIDDGTDFQIISKLDEERRRTDDYRIQLEQERIQNDQLLHENERLHQQFEINSREKERIFKNREKNLAQYLSDEQKKMMDLWTELQRVRKQLAEHKEQTAHDLENQKNEFIRVMRNVGCLTRQMNLTGVEGYGGGINEPLLADFGRAGGGASNIIQDTVLIEAIKRIREAQQTNGTQPGLQLLNELKLATAVTGDGDLYNELIKKYEECIERNIELESKGDEAQRKTAALESELRRTKERLADNQSALRKLHDIARSDKRGSDEEKRSRSLSPGGTPLPPSEALRSVRNIIRNKDNEIQQLERKLKIVENQIKDFTNKFEHADEARRALDKHLTDSKRELANQIKNLDDAERQIRRLEERLRTSESEKAAVEKARKYLEEEINRLHQQYQRATAEEERKARDKEQEVNYGLEEEYKNRINELTHRIEQIQRENTKLKTELNTMRDKYRDTENDYNITLRKLDEKDSALRHLDDMKRTLTNELNEQRDRYEAMNSEFDKLNTEYENSNKTIVTHEQTLREIKQQRDDYSKQKDELTRQLFDLKHKLENERVAHEDVEKARNRSLEEIEKLKLQITDCEHQMNMLRRHNDELDTQVKSGHAKITTFETDFITNHKEISKLNELNNRLQKEKQDAINQQLKAEGDVSALKELIKKYEFEVEKLKNENKTSMEHEAKIREALDEKTSRVYLLEKELEEARMEVESLEKKIKQLEQEFEDRIRGTIRSKSSDDDTGGRVSPGIGAVSGHDIEIHEIKVKEVNDKWKLKIDKILAEKDELEHLVRDLEEQIAEKNREFERQEADIAEIKRRHTAEIEKIKTELSNAYDKHQSDLDDEREQYNKNLESIKIVEDELRDMLGETQKKLAEAENKENQYARDIKDLREKYDAAYAEVQKLKDDLEDAHQLAESEIQKWKTDVYSTRSELNAVETANSALKSQINTMNERSDLLAKTNSDQSAKIRELSTMVRRLEEEIADLKSTEVVRQSDLDSTLSRLRSIEEQYSAMQNEQSKTRNEFELLQREYDLLKGTNTSNENDLDRLRKKMQQSEITIKEQKNALEHLKVERERLQNAHREKTKQVDHLNQLAQSFDAKLNKMRKILTETSDKLIAAESERDALRSEIPKLQQELQFGKDQMVRKTDEYQSSLEDIANAHRAAEDGRLNALQELESRKYELADLKSRLENTEQRLNALQQDYSKAESERDIITDTLRRFYSVTNHAISLHKVKEGVDEYDTGEADEFPHSIPFPSSIDYRTITGPHTGGTTMINIGENLDVNRLESTLQTLINRIGKLERERNEYRGALDRLKKKTSDAHTNIHKNETRYKTIEENLTDLEEERRGMDVRLASAKQLLRSQEEALKQRDDERRQLKAKMVAADLEARGKDAQLRHLNEQLKNLRNDLDNAHADVRSLRDHEERWEAARFQLESKLKDKDGETQRLSLLIVNLESEKQSLNERIKEIAGQLQLSEIKCSDMKEDLERLKKELMKAENIEVELRRTTDFHSRTINDYQMMKDEVITTQNDLINSKKIKQQLENELVTIRNELRDYKQRAQDLNCRSSDLQRTLQDAHNEKNRLEERLLLLEKANASQRVTEDELKYKVEVGKNERRLLQREVEELQRKVEQHEGERKTMTKQLEAVKRERIVLIKKIEIIENEKQRTDTAIRETSLQREAIEKSLNAMEKENKELYKNCAQLQQQITQLEMENGNRIIELTNKQREEQDRYMQRMRNEKMQIERIIESRERAHLNRIKQLENQLNIMREQLDNERRRRRDYIDRSFVGDITRLGSGYHGIRSNGIHSASGLPHIGDGLLRTIFASNPLTPPFGTSTPTQFQEVQHETVTAKSSQHPSLVGTSDYGRIEYLEPSKEIEEKRTKTVIVMKTSKLDE